MQPRRLSEGQGGWRGSRRGLRSHRGESEGDSALWDAGRMVRRRWGEAGRGRGAPGRDGQELGSQAASRVQAVGLTR